MLIHLDLARLGCPALFFMGLSITSNEEKKEKANVDELIHDSRYVRFFLSFLFPLLNKFVWSHPAILINLTGSPRSSLLPFHFLGIHSPLRSAVAVRS